MSAESPKVSVLMTVYNGENFLDDSIPSILNQTFENFEFLIFNDGSIDQTKLILKKYSNLDSRIRVFEGIKRMGIPKGRNFLVKRSSAKYVVWQDADDISLPQRIAKQYNFMEEHPQVGICGGYKEYFGATDQFIRTYYSYDKELRRRIFLYSPVDQPVAIIRKKAFILVGGYDESLFAGVEDLDMSFRIGQHFKFANIPEILIKYRESGNSSMHKNLHLIELNTIKIRLKYAFGSIYSWGLFDLIYNCLQFVSIFIFPKQFKIWLFHQIRDSKKTSKGKSLPKSFNLFMAEFAHKIRLI